MLLKFPTTYNFKQTNSPTTWKSKGYFFFYNVQQTTDQLTNNFKSQKVLFLFFYNSKQTTDQQTNDLMKDNMVFFFFYNFKQTADQQTNHFDESNKFFSSSTMSSRPRTNWPTTSKIKMFPFFFLQFQADHGLQWKLTCFFLLLFMDLSCSMVWMVELLEFSDFQFLRSSKKNFCTKESCTECIKTNP